MVAITGMKMVFDRDIAMMPVTEEKKSTTLKARAGIGSIMLTMAKRQ